MGDKVADGIGHMESAPTGGAASGPVTTLQGVRLNASVESLPEGIYIVEGRKVVVVSY